VVGLFLAVVLALAACSNVNGPAPAQQVGGLGPGWQSVDVGSVATHGAATVTRQDSSGTPKDMTVEGGGADIWGTSDAFHFVYEEKTGDFQMTMRVKSIHDSNAWAKAGLMIRDTLAPDSVHAMVDVTPAGVVEFIWREATGGDAQATVVDNVSVPTWLRISRQNDVVTGYYSSDGTTWTRVQSVRLPYVGADYAGVAVTSHVSDMLTQAQIADLTLSGPAGSTPPSPPGPTPTSAKQWVCPSQPLTPQYSPTMYVSTNGSDSNSGRDASHPLRTLQAAANLAHPGDVVWVSGGVYSTDVAFNTSGTSGQPIVYESAPGDCAVLDGTGLSRNQVVRLESVQYNVLRNFVIRNSPGEGVLLMSSSHNTVSNLSLHNNQQSGIMNIHGSDNLFTHFISYSNYDPNDSPPGGNADGISINTGDSNHIQYCVAYNNSDDGIDVWMSTYSVVEHCVSYHNGYQASGDGNGVKAGGPVTGHALIRNVLSWDNKDAGFTYNDSVGVTFQNDTAYANHGYGFVLSNGTAQNNLSIGNGNGNYGTWGTNNTLQNNSWQLGIGNGGFASTDATNPDFLSLGSGSAAIDAGIDIGLPYAGSAPDLGALEYGQTILSTIDGLSLSNVTSH
jgi:regulation of enolase protein 1 (concanavalin A-like superfamily)